MRRLLKLLINVIIELFRKLNLAGGVKRTAAASACAPAAAADY